MAAKWRRSHPEGAVRGCPQLLPIPGSGFTRGVGAAVRSEGGGAGSATEPRVGSAPCGAGGEAPCGAQRRLRGAAPRERCGAAPELCGAPRSEGVPGPSAALRRSTPRFHRLADVHLQAGYAGRRRPPGFHQRRRWVPQRVPGRDRFWGKGEDWGPGSGRPRSPGWVRPPPAGRSPLPPRCTLRPLLPSPLAPVGLRLWACGHRVGHPFPGGAIL